MRASVSERFADGVVVVTAEGAARIVRVHRPERRNALSREVLLTITRAARAIGRDRDARGIVVTGAPPAFMAGADFAEVAKIRSAGRARRLALLGHDAIDALRATGLPLIAAVNGDAHGGGCELAAACDWRVVDETASFHWVQGRFAVTTAWGATARLVELVGPAVATRWLLQAATVPAHEALEAGFANERASKGTAVATAVRFVEQVARTPRSTVARQLRLLRSYSEALRAQHRVHESREFGAAWASREHHDAVARFLARTS